MPHEWDAKAAELEQDLPHLGRYPVPGLLRRARRMADLSQRQFAKAARVAPSTVGKIESGQLVPSLDVFQRLLAAAKLHLVVVDGNGHVVEPMRESEETRDGADRRYPSHLDTILDPRPGEWWADAYGLARPPETFYRNRKRRDEMRARSRWEVRVKQLRNAPEPPRPGVLDAYHESIRRAQEEWLKEDRPPTVDVYELDWDE
jgi:transcriptional regulator with XRE-family HTH domain